MIYRKNKKNYYEMHLNKKTKNNLFCKLKKNRC
jgi:hypothetical protein